MSQPQEVGRGPQVVGDFFRHESGRLLSVLVRLLGASHFREAEDIVNETLCAALERWRFGSLPSNPAAWLTTAAKRRALDHLRRRDVADRHAMNEAASKRCSQAVQHKVDACFDREVDDDVLRLMFSCCVHRLSRAAQVTLILKAVSGFSVREIAHALLCSEAAVEKRLSRAKDALRDEGLLDVGDAKALRARLTSVQCAVYLLFSEGYHGAHGAQVVRSELCVEALRLGGLLVANPTTGDCSTHALTSLMCFLTARLDARQDARGDLLALQDQDRSRWNDALQRLGFEHLARSAGPGGVSSFHIQAALAAAHASAPTWAETDWDQIAGLYELLISIDDGPVVRLNHAVAVGQRDGAQAGLDALDTLPRRAHAALARYPFLPAARARWLACLGRVGEALAAYEHAFELARNDAERTFFDRRTKTLGAQKSVRSRPVDPSEG